MYWEVRLHAQEDVLKEGAALAPRGPSAVVEAAPVRAVSLRHHPLPVGRGGPEFPTEPDRDHHWLVSPHDSLHSLWMWRLVGMLSLSSYVDLFVSAYTLCKCAIFVSAYTFCKWAICISFYFL